MAKRPRTFDPRGRTPEQRAIETDRYRGSARDRGYTAQWDRASKAYLREHPLCVYCALQGNPVTGATCVDHLFPHDGDQTIFWFVPWWVASCGPCHNSFKQATERAGPEAVTALARRLGRPLSMTGSGG